MPPQLLLAIDPVGGDLTFFVAVAGTAFSLLTGIVAWMSKFALGRAVEKLKDQDDAIGQLKLGLQRAQDRIDNLKVQLGGDNPLTAQLFQIETAHQNEKLDAMAVQNAELARTIRSLERELANRPTHSQMSMAAVRPPQRRNDGPYDSGPPDPPPMRPRSPSRPR